MASVTIKFEGKQGSGKTLTSRLVSKVLHEHGIVYQFVGDDTITFTPYNAERLAKAGE